MHRYPRPISRPRAYGGAPTLNAMQRRVCELFPAHTGVDRRLGCGARQARARPRAYGGGPVSVKVSRKSDVTSSPFVRGWTAEGLDQGRRLVLFPVRTGVDRPASSRRLRPCCASPYARGCTVQGAPRDQGDQLLPVCAGVDRRSIATAISRKGASPCARGWTGSLQGGTPSRRRFPVCAGVDRPMVP